MQMDSKSFQKTFVDSVANDSDVWDRCGSMSSLSIQEQIQQLDYFCRWRALLEFLHRHDSALRNDVLMKEHVYPKVAEILGYNPRQTDRRAKRGMAGRKPQAKKRRKRK